MPVGKLGKEEKQRLLFYSFLVLFCIDVPFSNNIFLNKLKQAIQVVSKRMRQDLLILTKARRKEMLLNMLIIGVVKSSCTSVYFVNTSLEAWQVKKL